MPKIEIVYHLIVIGMSVALFFPKIETDFKKAFNIPLKIMFKLAPMYCVAFSCSELIGSFF